MQHSPATNESVSESRTGSPALIVGIGTSAGGILACKMLLESAPTDAEFLRAHTEELRSLVEQLEIANEEYRASHEELLSLKKELQSGNEELETSKEAQQSLNEELTTINRQLEERNSALHTLASDLNNLLVSSAIPTLVLDRQLRIRRFTSTCTEVMRIVPADVGRSLDHVKMQVRDETLLSDAGRVLESLVSVGVEVPADDGRWFARRVLPYRTEDERIDGVCITYYDISALKRTSAELEASRSYAEAIIRASRMPLLVLDATLSVVSASDAFYETFQVSKGETEGRKIYELGNRQWDIPELRTLLEEVLPRGHDFNSYQMEHTFERIGWRALRLRGHLLPRTGRHDLILVSIEDITDFRGAEMAVQRRADQLAEEHRRKDAFLAMLGHELRNPLSALANGLYLIRKRNYSPERLEEMGAMMARQTRRMTTLLSQLLDVGRVVTGKLDMARNAVDITESIRLAVETVTPLIDDARHELTISCPPEGTVFVLGDGDRLAQIGENLLTNSVKYTSGGGQIWLTVEATDEIVTFSVRDNGAGMEASLLEHAFELFAQGPRSLERARGGMGLGLSLVRSLVEMHQGHVEASSAGLGQGSEVVVTLPRLRSGRSELPCSRQAPAHMAVPYRVLVVEDEEDSAVTLVKFLGEEGHEVRAVFDGLAVLAAAREFKPEIVLLDLGLPKLDGYEVARQLRGEHGGQMRIIAMTGYQRDTERLKKAGFDEHLLKPPDMDRLSLLIAAREA